MSQEEIIQHWRQGARDALAAAHLLHKNGFYESALFHCHLAAEKALKSLYMDQHGEDHPYTHDLAHLATLIDHTLGKSDVKALQELSGFVVDARYSDLYWAEEEATKENSERWIAVSNNILSSLLHEEN